jgi:predicted O-methyltransferase YrrM
VNIDRALTVQGWMSETELNFLAETASKCEGDWAEIGSYKGRSACAVAPHLKGHLYCIDIWSECGTDGWYYDVFKENTKHLDNIVSINRSSVWAAREFAALGMSFSCIFIDAGHDQYSVRQDILAWRPLLAEGGVFCGHDFDHIHHPDVATVVREMIPKFSVVDSIWIEEK